VNTITTGVDLETIKQVAEELATDIVYDDNGRLAGYEAEQEDDNCSGLYRTVIIQDGIAYKIQRRNPSNQNLREWKRYRLADPALRAIMAEALYLSNCRRVLAMECVEVVLVNVESKYAKKDAFNKVLRDTMRDLGYPRDIINTMTNDNHPANIGIGFDGVVKWIDYAGEMPSDWNDEDGDDVDSDGE